MSEPTVIIVNGESEPEPAIEPVIEPVVIEPALSENDVLELAQLRADRDARIEVENDETRRIADLALATAELALLEPVIEPEPEPEPEPIIDEIVEPDLEPETPPNREHPWFKTF